MQGDTSKTKLILTVEKHYTWQNVILPLFVGLLNKTLYKAIMQDQHTTEFFIDTFYISHKTHKVIQKRYQFIELPSLAQLYGEIIIREDVIPFASSCT